MLEARFEEKVKNLVQAKGGLCLKWVSPGVDGVPDRICLFPNGKVIFLELKRPGRKDGRSERQKRFLARLAGMGFMACKVASMEEVEEILKEI